MLNILYPHKKIIVSNSNFRNLSPNLFKLSLWRLLWLTYFFWSRTLMYKKHFVKVIFLSTVEIVYKRINSENEILLMRVGNILYIQTFAFTWILDIYSYWYWFIVIYSQKLFGPSNSTYVAMIFIFRTAGFLYIFA